MFKTWYHAHIRVYDTLYSKIILLFLLERSLFLSVSQSEIFLSLACHADIEILYELHDFSTYLFVFLLIKIIAIRLTIRFSLTITITLSINLFYFRKSNFSHRQFHILLLTPQGNNIFLSGWPAWRGATYCYLASYLLFLFWYLSITRVLLRFEICSLFVPLFDCLWKILFLSL
jgi:hypothetical protein